jgi:pyridoxamine-phosphate oxidase
MSIEEMRKNYAMAGLNEQDIDRNPMVQFQRWFEEAQQPDLPDWVEVNAMTLSTADDKGKVTSRVVLLKGIESGKLFFYTNYDSTKGCQMKVNPRVSLCFFWPHLQRQVRIEGNVEKTDRAQSESYFQKRPRASQLGACVSQQSSMIENRQVLEQRMSELESEFAEAQVPCPDNWGGYEVSPIRFEFWQGRPSRLHDRVCFELQEGDGAWSIQRLSP